MTDAAETTRGSGLLQLRARTYWPLIGRFLTQDPIRNGVSWYAYVEDRPVVRVDPEGLDESASFWHNMGDLGTWAAGLTQGAAILADTASIFGNPYQDRGMYDAGDPLIAAAEASAGVGVAAVAAIGAGEGLSYVGGRLGAQIVVRPGGSPGIALRLANLGRRLYAIALHGPHHEFPWLAAQLGLASGRMWHLQLWAAKKGAEACAIRIPLRPE